MKAVRIHACGGPEALIFEEAPCPEPQADEVLIRVRAAGVNPVDCRIRRGEARELARHALPLIPGWDVSGVVAAVGRGVHRLKEGDEVFALLPLRGDGACAEYAVAREAVVAPRPLSIPHPAAAAVPMAALAAWQSLFDAGGLRAGQTLLVHGNAGDVGGFAVQFAKWKGARAIGTASGWDRGFLESLGADEIVDAERTRFETVVHDADVVLDTVGQEVLARSWRVLRPGGILVSVAVQPSPEEALRCGVRQAFVSATPSAAELAEIAALVDAQRIRPVVDTVLPLADAREAHRRVEAGDTRGKIVLRVD